MSRNLTAATLARLNTAELRALQTQLQKELVQTERGSQRRCELLGQLEQLSAALARSYLLKPRF